MSAEKKVPNELYSQQNYLVKWNPETGFYRGILLGSRLSPVHACSKQEVLEKLEELLSKENEQKRLFEEKLSKFQRCPNLEDILPIAKEMNIESVHALWDLLEKARHVWISFKNC